MEEKVRYFKNRTTSPLVIVDLRKTVEPKQVFSLKESEVQTSYDTLKLIDANIIQELSFEELQKERPEINYFSQLTSNTEVVSESDNDVRLVQCTFVSANGKRCTEMVSIGPNDDETKALCVLHATAVDLTSDKSKKKRNKKSQ